MFIYEFNEFDCMNVRDVIKHIIMKQVENVHLAEKCLKTDY